ncbi:hypothetical protein G5C60_12050 [Streptomyces sp. HC44]|uniref:Uncharacterized protein n=1 Tax=Streptomyces scabichelini TaxID=2711217 RepID=A0A6G4V2V6_9ACTN|nr:hypothetical protein [Streptomyces scabichelini]NGO08336.1 hypothetical protein [Streptomyces scabichelini]
MTQTVTGSEVARGHRVVGELRVLACDMHQGAEQFPGGAPVVEQSGRVPRS